MNPNLNRTAQPNRSSQTRWWNSRNARRLRGNKLSLIGFGLVTFFVLIAAFAPLLAPPTGLCLRDLGGSSDDPGVVLLPLNPGLWQALFLTPESCLQIPRYSLASQPVSPSATTPFGTVQGYDIRYGLVWGTRTALTFGIVVVSINIVIGVLIGLIAGYFGGVIDDLMMRFTDIVLAFPSIVLTMVLVAILGQGLFNIGLSFVLVGWPFYARLIRGEVLRVRQLEYIEAARALGSGHAKTLVRHVAPNALGPLLSVGVLDLGTVPLIVGALSFIGLGTPPGFADWGQLIQFAQQWVQGPPDDPFAYWYVSLYPGLCVLLYSLGWNLVGDALQDSQNVRAR
jgi:peptide/nickel transport system permease protein